MRFDAVIVPPGITERTRRLLGTVMLVDGVLPPSEKTFSIDQVLKDWTSVPDGREFRITQKP